MKNNNVILILIFSKSFWGTFSSFILSTSNRIFIGWFGVLMFPLLSAASVFFIVGFLYAPPVDIDYIREPIAGSLLYPCKSRVVIVFCIIFSRCCNDSDDKDDNENEKDGNSSDTLFKSPNNVQYLL